MLDRSILPEPSSTRALVVDLGDPTAPAVVHDATYGGGLVSARQYGDVVRLVVSRTTPAIDFVYPDRVRTEREATRENRRLLRESTVDDWLPRVSTGDPGAVTGQPVGRSTEQRPDRPAAGERLMGCDAVEHPEAGAGFGTVSVVTFRADDPAARRTTGVTASGETVYSSGTGSTWPPPTRAGDGGASATRWSPVSPRGYGGRRCCPRGCTRSTSTGSPPATSPPAGSAAWSWTAGR